MSKSLINNFPAREFAGVVLVSLLAALGSNNVKPEIVKYPEEIDRSCRDGRAKIYDECSNQLELYAKALERARIERKTLLVSYGAEWCIWCHVFAKYIDGQTNKFTHTFSRPDDRVRRTETLFERPKVDPTDDAEKLLKYVADHFVVVHVDYKYALGGDDVLSTSGADAKFDDWLPFIFTVTPDNAFAMKLDPDRVQVRRDTDDWFRGYDRQELLKMLTEMRAAAQ